MWSGSAINIYLCINEEHKAKALDYHNKKNLKSIILASS